MKEKLAIRMENVTKKFGEFVANDKINLEVKKGEIHAILGENGAGKSTLMNILYGLYSPTFGKVYVNGVHKKLKSPIDAIDCGIGMVHQHFMLVKPFTIAENIILGVEPRHKYGFMDMEKAKKEIEKLSKKYSLDVNVDAIVSQISVGMQQRVEILKALYRKANILILDEPTAVLTPQEIIELGKIMKNLASQGKSIIFITHKLKEIKALADKCTIIRLGKYIKTVDVKNVTSNDLATMMVGRSVDFKIEKQLFEGQKVIFEVKDLVVNDDKGLPKVKGLSLDVKSSEILGIAGIDGNGQEELIEGIVGLRKVESGKITFKGEDITDFTPKQTYGANIAHIPADRHKYGLVLDFPVKENLILQKYSSNSFSTKFVLDFFKIKKYAMKLIEKFDVRPKNIEKKARNLSGGNQQKVILAREIESNPDLLIATQPTRGLDVGAIEFVHKSIVKQKNSGKAVLLISLELDEILKLSDRIAVIFDGKILGIMDSSEADRDKIGLLMSGGTA